MIWGELEPPEPPPQPPVRSPEPSMATIVQDLPAQKQGVCMSYTGLCESVY